MMIMLFVIVQLVVMTNGKTVQQYNAETAKQVFKQAETKYLTEDGFLTNEVDSLKVVKEEPWNGRKAPIWELDDVQYPYYQWDIPQADETTSKLLFTPREKQDIYDENLAYMQLIAEHCFNGTLGRMPEDLGGDKQFEALGVNYEAPRLTVEFTVNTRIYEWRAVAWAFPGEVVTLEFPKDLNLAGVKIAIGKMNSVASHSHLVVKKWGNENIRMPIDTMEFDLNTISHLIVDNKVKIGSPLGGNIYIYSPRYMNGNKPFVLKAHNVGRAPIFIIGENTNEDWENHLKNAPGNVVELNTPGARLVFTRNRLPADFDADFATKFWYRAHSNADQICWNPDRPVVMYYDQRVDAGAAVAFVNRYFTQHPSDWATGAVSKNNLLHSGAWGTLHEFNHHKQTTSAGVSWGIDPTGESTNNALNMILYVEYTNVAASRVNVLDGWNWVSDGYATMNYVFTGTNVAQRPLQFYSTIVHAFGTQKLIDIINSYGTYQKEFETNVGGKFQGINLKSGEAYCYLASLATKKDMRYACEKFGYPMSDAISNAIAELDYDTYYPFFNKYCMYYGDNRYGRPYSIAFNAPMIIDFMATTAIDPNATEVSIKFGQSPKGTVKAVDGKPNVFKYTPDLKVNEVTSFTVIITCKIEEKSVTVTLKGEFIGNADINPVHKYIVPKASKLETSIDESLPLIEGKEADGILLSKSMSTTVYDSGEDTVLMVTEGNLVIKEAGYYTFYLKADDAGRLNITVNDTEITVAIVKFDIQNYNIKHDYTFDTLYMPVGYYPYSIYNYNNGGKGFGVVGYCYHGTNPDNIKEKACAIKDVGSDMVVPAGITEDVSEPEFEIPAIKYWRKGRYLTYNYRVTPVCQPFSDDTCPVKCLELPELHKANENACSNMFDRDSSTNYHSKWQNGGIKFPVTYELQFDKPTTFNYMYLHYRRGIDSWGNYKIYGKSGVDGEYEEIKTMNTTGQVEHSITFDDYYTFDHVKVIVDSNGAGNTYVNVQDMYFGIAAETYANFSKPFGNNIQSISGFGTRKQVGAFGNFLVENTNAGSGELCFNFKGKEFGLFGHRTLTSGKGKVVTESKEYDFDESYFMESVGTLFFTHKYETVGNHYVCVKVTEGHVNIDMVGFS